MQLRLHRGRAVLLRDPAMRLLVALAVLASIALTGFGYLLYRLTTDIDFHPPQPKP